MSPFANARRLHHAALLLLATGLLAAGCAAPPKPMAMYTPPAAGPTSKLVMRANVPAGHRFGVYMYSDSERCAGVQSVGIGDSTRNPASTALAANQIATIEFVLLTPSRQFCSIRYSFTPTAGKTYLFNGFAIDKGCAARMMDMSDPDNIKPEAGVLRRNPGSNVCLPLSQSRAATTTADSGQKSGDAVLRQGAGSDDLQGLIAH